MLKKIAILCFSHNSGGMELDAVRMSRRLSAQMDVTLVAPKKSAIERWAKKDIECGYVYRFVECRVTRILARGFVDPNIFWCVRSLLKNRPDILIFFGTSEIKSISVALLGSDAKLLMRIGTTINNVKNGFFKNIFYSRVNAFIATSDHIKNNIIKCFPVASSRIVSVCHPVIEFNSEYINKKNSEKKINIIYHSRFVRGKGQLDAVIAFNMVRRLKSNSEINFDLKLVGNFEDLDYVNEILFYIECHSLSDVVKVIPHCDSVQLMLNNSHIFLAPSYGEGFSNSFAEALASGLICVVYDNTVFPYFKKIGFDFFSAPTGDINLLSKELDSAIKKILNKDFDSEENIKLAKNLFSREVEIKVLEKVFESL